MHRLKIKRLLRGMFDLVLPVFWWGFQLAVFAIRPAVIIKVGKVSTERIGHMIANLEFFLRKKSLAAGGSEAAREPAEFFVVPRDNANGFAMELIGRRVKVISGDLLWRFYDAARRRWPDHPVWIDTSTTGPYEFEIWEKTEPQLLKLEKSEMSKGRELLESMGIAATDSFVCFSVRDRLYLDQAQPHDDTGRWSLHNYRDANVENYYPMIRWFADQGVKVVRMGAAVSQPLALDGPNIIDYAWHHRTPFLDILLSAQCDLYVGDSSGSFWMPLAFERPLAQANLVPLTHPGRGAGTVFTPKKFRQMSDDAYVPYGDVVAMGGGGLNVSEDYARLGLALEENSADEVLEMAKERYLRATGNWEQSRERTELQTLYWSIFPKSHPVHGSPAVVSTYFMEQNASLFD